MTKHEYKQSAYYLLYLIRCVLNNKVPAENKLNKMNLSHIYSVSKAHSLTAIAAYALESAVFFDKQFEEAKNKAIRKNIVLDVERERVIKELETNGIWYAPLKGIILKDYYPEIGMRQMADNDILFDSAYRDKVRHIMTELNFEAESYNKGNHDIYQKPPVCNFEMHVSLFSEASKNKMYSYYRNIKDRLIKSENKDFEYKFTDEDLYIYLTAHEYKHFSKGGTGLRSLVDTYVFLKKFSDTLDFSYIENELKILGISDFEYNRQTLAMKLFSGHKLDTDDKQLLDYYIFSGTYGTIENSVNNSVSGSAVSKFKYISDRLFLTMPQIKSSYPFFYKHKFLLPLLFLYRIGRMLTQSRKRVLSEIKTLIKI